MDGGVFISCNVTDYTVKRNMLEWFIYRREPNIKYYSTGIQTLTSHEIAQLATSTTSKVM